VRNKINMLIAVYQSYGHQETTWRKHFQKVVKKLISQKSSRKSDDSVSSLSSQTSVSGQSTNSSSSSSKVPTLKKSGELAVIEEATHDV